MFRQSHKMYYIYLFNGWLMWNLRSRRDMARISRKEHFTYLTRFTDYALRVLIFVAHRISANRTIRDVAEAHRVSKAHLMKVVHSLSKLGYLTTVRGKGGGIRSARPPSDISVGGVIRDVEPTTPSECFVAGHDRRRDAAGLTALRAG